MFTPLHQRGKDEYAKGWNDCLTELRRIQDVAKTLYLYKCEHCKRESWEQASNRYEVPQEKYCYCTVKDEEKVDYKGEKYINRTSGKMKYTGETKRMQVCKHCTEHNLESNFDWECPDEPHHGSEAECDECGANYYTDYSGEIQALNFQAKFNHPEYKYL